MYVHLQGEGKPDTLTTPIKQIYLPCSYNTLDVVYCKQIWVQSDLTLNWVLDV